MGVGGCPNIHMVPAQSVSSSSPLPLEFSEPFLTSEQPACMQAPAFLCGGYYRTSKLDLISLNPTATQPTSTTPAAAVIARGQRLKQRQPLLLIPVDTQSCPSPWPQVAGSFKELSVSGVVLSGTSYSLELKLEHSRQWSD